MKKYLVLTCLVATLIVGMSGCKKYEEGPLLSFRGKFERVVNTWKPKFIFRDQVDVTAWYTDWTLDLREDGRLTQSDLNDADSLVSQEGYWDLVNDNEDLQFLYTVPAVNPDRMTVHILKLKEEELWFENVTDSAVWQYRLIPATASAE